MMATLKRSFLLASRGRPFLCQLHRCLSLSPATLHWNQDWKPGPIPTTPEERAKAAKKYGLRPEDYNCLIDNEAGDYPDLPPVSKRSKDPFEDYDFPGINRNFKEPIYVNNEYLGSDIAYKEGGDTYSYGQICLYAILIFVGFVGSCWLTMDYRLTLPQMPKQYPFNDLYLENGGEPALEKEVKHYTFEPADEE